MQIAQVLAGYTLGGADLLRRAMGKKKPEEMAKQREIFAGGRGSAAWMPRSRPHIFDLMEKFAGYGFNKSHSAAYALVSYQTAWLKAHYPAEFMAAVLSADMDNTDKVVTLIDECRDMKLESCRRTSMPRDYRFTVRADDTIRLRPGRDQGRGAGRDRGHPRRASTSGAFSRSVRLLPAGRPAQGQPAGAGGPDTRRRAWTLGANRATLMATARGDATGRAGPRDQASGQDDLFGGLAVSAAYTRRRASRSPDLPE